MGNVLHLGDRMICRLLWASSSGGFPVIVRGFPGRDVQVEAEDRSDDPMVDNEWVVPFCALSRPAA